jgi:serine/threonine protein kinase
LTGILGTGAYGVVYSAVDYYTGITYAVKALSKTNSNGQPLDRRQREFQDREIQLHYAASAHPNIVSMLKILDDKDCTYVVLEYCPEGDLFSNITEKGRYVSNDTLVKKAFLQILDAVEHCHRLGVYHRDLKPENILVSQAGSEVLLADFGLATTDAESDDHGCGSTFYMSPECLDQSSRKPSYRCAPNDIWSLGVILVNLTCGRNPWKQASAEDSTYRAFTRNRNFLKTILPLSDELNDILGMIFERNPEDRITVGELKQQILACRQFYAPIRQTLTPPQSPRVSADSLCSSISNSSSSVSDEGSLTGSASTISDDSGSDSGYDSMDADSDDASEVFEKPQRQAAPFTQQYVLPSEEPYQKVPVQKPVAHNQYVVPQNPWIQAWSSNVSNGYPYGHVQPVPQAYNPVPYHPFSPFQYAREGYCY